VKNHCISPLNTYSRYFCISISNLPWIAWRHATGPRPPWTRGERTQLEFTARDYEFTSSWRQWNAVSPLVNSWSRLHEFNGTQHNAAFHSSRELVFTSSRAGYLSPSQILFRSDKGFRFRACATSRTIVESAIFLGVLEITYSQDATTDIVAKYGKRRGSVQGCAFWGSQNHTLTSTPPFYPKTAIFGPDYDGT